jgi:hypothetical protein
MSSTPHKKDQSHNSTKGNNWQNYTPITDNTVQRNTRLSHRFKAYTTKKVRKILLDGTRQRNEDTKEVAQLLPLVESRGVTHLDSDLVSALVRSTYKGLRARAMAALGGETKLLSGRGGARHELSTGAAWLWLWHGGGLLGVALVDSRSERIEMVGESSARSLEAKASRLDLIER